MIVISQVQNNLIFFGPPLKPSPPENIVTGTSVLQLPINCVIIGDQPEEKKSRFVTDFSGVLKNIFRE